jgi:hypothetical protein
VAAFESDADLTRPADYLLLVNGFVQLFRRTSALDETVTTLDGLGYDVVRADASGWQNDDDLHRDLAAVLSFPDDYGRNLDALNDCLGDVVSYSYGTSAEATGFALVLTGYDRFAGHRPATAQAALDTFARQARAGALIGHRMVCLVQCDDRATAFAPVGGQPIAWHDAG